MSVHQVQRNVHCTHYSILLKAYQPCRSTHNAGSPWPLLWAAAWLLAHCWSLWRCRAGSGLRCWVYWDPAHLLCTGTEGSVQHPGPAVPQPRIELHCSEYSTSTEFERKLNMSDIFSILYFYIMTEYSTDYYQSCLINMKPFPLQQVKNVIYNWKQLYNYIIFVYNYCSINKVKQIGVSN